MLESVEISTHVTITRVLRDLTNNPEDNSDTRPPSNSFDREDKIHEYTT